MQSLSALGALRGWRRKAIRARGVIAQALRNDALWCVSFSGGKDSTVLLDLTLAVKPDLDIIWFDDGWDYPETISFLAAVEARLGRRILRVEMPVRSSFWGREIAYGGDDPSYSHACDMDYEAWARQYTGALIGMRKEESKQRYFTLLRRGEVYYHKGLGHWHCCPLASWTWQDVWGYILGNGLSYNPVYDRLEKLGVAPAQARVGPLTAWMVYQYGALATLKRGWPDLYNRFCAAHPEARAYG